MFSISHFAIPFRCHVQRYNYRSEESETSPIQQKRMKMLKEINFEFVVERDRRRLDESAFMEKWMKRYAELKAFSDANGSTRVPHEEPYKKLWSW